MPVYHLVFLLLLCSMLIEYYIKRTPQVLYLLCFAALTCMLCFRFAQGTDYSAYRMIYYTMPKSVSGTINYAFAKAEIGWRFLCMFFRCLNLNFSVFVMFISAMEMALLWRFISKYCECKLLALFLGYHTLYFTYMFSAMRQGTVILVFLGVLLPWLLEGKYVRYLIGASLLLSIHSVALVIFIPAILQLVRLSVEQIIAFVLIGIFAGGILSIVGVGRLLSLVGIAYGGETNISVFALTERILSFVFVSYMYYVYIDGYAPDQKDPMFMLFKLYAVGIFLYGLLMWSPLISSRLIYLFKVLEIPLISTCILKCRKLRMLALLYFLMLSSTLYIKNISSSIQQGEYLNTSVWNYPYFTIFNPEGIREYRNPGAPYFQWLFTN